MMDGYLQLRPDGSARAHDDRVHRERRVPRRPDGSTAYM
jgi:hypothetical protein